MIREIYMMPCYPVTKHVEKLRQSLSKDESIIAAFDFEPFIGYGAILLDR